MTIFEQCLEQNGMLLADGATGTSMFELGLPTGEAPELWSELEPEKVEGLGREFVEAGADLILTNSFGGNRCRLALHGREEDAVALNRRAAEIACRAAAFTSRPVVVAGSIGPTGEILEPVGSFSQAAAIAAFEEQGQGLIEGGAEILWGETLSSLEEAGAIAAAAARLNVPYCMTLSFDTAGCTMMGIEPTAFAEFALGLAHRPLAIGANCGTGASDLLATLLGFGDAAGEIPLIAKANAGIPAYVDGHIHYSSTPEIMACYATLARDAGARIIGACCGSKGSHIAAMREALQGTPRGPRPTHEQIIATTGDFVQAAPQQAGEAVARVRRRRLP